MSEPVLALDIGGTKIAAALVTGGHVGEVCRVATPASQGPEAVVAAAVAVAKEARGESRPVLVGIGSAGVIDSTNGVVTHATDALPGWAGTPLARGVSEGLGLAAYALNDVHAHALGEASFGAGRGLRDVLLVAVGTGVGGAVVHRGEVIFGAHAVAGHLGHIPASEAAGLPCTCGRVGHLEALASGPGLAAALRREGGSAQNGRDVVVQAGQLGAAGEAARAVLTLGGVALGRVIGGLVNTLDPDVVVLAGSVADAGLIWWASVQDGVRQEAMDAVRGIPLVPAGAGAAAALLGAAHFAMTRHASKTVADDGQGL